MTLYANSPSLFWPLRGNNNISTFSEGSWTSATASTSTLPRLTTSENANNFQPNSIWYKDASYLKLVAGDYAIILAGNKPALLEFVQFMNLKFS